MAGVGLEREDVVVVSDFELAVGGGGVGDGCGVGCVVAVVVGGRGVVEDAEVVRAGGCGVEAVDFDEVGAVGGGGPLDVGGGV